MKAKLTLLLIFIILFIGFVAVKFFILDKQNIYGQLKITSSPTTSVFINNVAIGKTPFYEKHKIGEYILKLIPEGTATETASWQGKINLYKNSLTFVNRELGSSDITSTGEVLTVTKMEKPPKSSNLGEIYVETEPAGAIVNLDNDEKGVAPLMLEDVTQGEHELSIFMPGFFRRTQKINVEAGYRVNASIKLAIDQTKGSTPTGTATDKTEGKESTPSADTEKGSSVTIKETPTGWLRVREEPSIDASESAKIKPGETYDLVEEKDNWYKIKYNNNKDGLVEGEFSEGWISVEYATKK